MSAAAPADLRGLVDNASADCLFGWAWNAAAPEERVTVELRLDDRVLATVCADVERPDLSGAGIGDGRHAFMLRLPPEAREKRAGLSVVARSPGAPPMPIPVRIARTRDRMEPARRDVVASRETRAGAGLEQRLTEVGERLDTIALWLERIERRIAEPGRAPAPAGRRLDPWQAGVVVLLALVALAALARVAGLVS